MVFVWIEKIDLKSSNNGNNYMLQMGRILQLFAMLRQQMRENDGQNAVIYVTMNGFGLFEGVVTLLFVLVSYERKSPSRSLN